MEKTLTDSSFFGSERIGKILLKMGPPVMLALLIQALYNIVDSFFVGKYSVDALTALTVIYPLQLIIVALAVGTGVGVNTYMARQDSLGDHQSADEAGGTGTVLAVLSWAIFAVLSVIFMRPYVRTSASSPAAVEGAVIYGNIVCIGSLGTMLEGNWSKVLQARGDMKIPMLGQVAGALTNIVLDPLLIFGIGPFPELGVAGAAYATIAGQFAAAVITGIRAWRKPPKVLQMLRHVKWIYFYGYSSIIMQMLYTVYIVALNMILASFSDAAVTVLGLYYKMQSFFFIPLMGLSTCIVPVLSFNYARKEFDRCKELMTKSYLISLVFMLVGFICFVCFPNQCIGLFSDSAEVHEIGRVAFRIIGTSFFFAVFSLMCPVFFQAIGDGKTSVFLIVLRQIICLIPIFGLLALIGVNYTWLAFPLSEGISGITGLILYCRVIRKWKQPLQK